MRIPLLSRILDDTAARAVAAYQQEQQKAREEALALIERAQTGAGVYPSIPTPPTSVSAGQYPIYARDEPWRYLTPQAPYRKPESPVTTEMLRRLADSWDILRACVAPDTLVFCRSGLVPISEIKVGDEVLTHRGRWRRVTECLVHPRYETVYRVESRSLDPLVATGNHPIYAARYHRAVTNRAVLDGIEWRRVDDLLPQIKMRRNDAALLPALQFVGRKELALAPAMGERFYAFKGELRAHGPIRRFNSMPAKVPFGAELGRLLGWYLAEGCGGGGRAIHFCLGPREQHVAAQLLCDVRSLFGLDGKFGDTQAGNGIQVTVHSSALAALFNCGTARTKRLPVWAWNGSREFFAAVLDGWSQGDGHIERRGSLRARCSVRTSSKTLAEQMRLVAISLGYAATVKRGSVRKQLPIIRGKEIHTHPESYVVQWAPENSPVGHHRFEQGGKLLTHAVESLTPIEYEDLVYNLEVEEDESYTTTSGIIHNCLSHLQREVVNVPIQFVPKDDADKSERTQARIKEATVWFEEDGGVGGLGARRSLFESQVVEDLEVIGATALYFSPTRGGGVYEVLAIDAATIRPVVDPLGWLVPGECYEQYIYGVPIARYTREELLYDGIHSRTWTPYFASPVEWLVARILTALKVDEWDRSWLTDGAMPTDLIALPETWTPEQIREYAGWFVGLLRGDASARNGVPKFVPNGTTWKTQTRKDMDFGEFKKWLTLCTCAVLGVHGASIGLEEGQYAVTQKNSMAATSEFGVAALLDFRQSLYNRILKRLGYVELECRNVTAEEEEASERAERNAKLVTSGIKTPNEARADEGLDAMPGGENLFIPTTLTPLDLALNPPEPTVAGEDAESSGDRAAADERRVALSLWQKKALRRLKDGKAAECAFEHEALESDLELEVRAALSQVETAEEVRAVFAKALIDLPPLYHTSVQQHERQQIGAKWAARRVAAEREG